MGAADMTGFGARTVPRILAIVESEAEAEAARAAGAMAILAGGFAEAEGAPLIRVQVSSPLDPQALRRAADGSSGTLVLDASPDRLLDRVPFAELSRTAGALSAEGVPFGFAGGLEAADIVRLVILYPAMLVVQEAVRDASGALDPAKLREMVALVRPVSSQAPHPRPDRVFVRDLVQEMEVGAYASERGRLQRVRFGVEAELAPVSGSRSLADIYSYDLMMDAVHALVARAPEPFVETLAETLAAEILADPRVQAVSVRVEKLDLGPGAAGVEIRRERADAGGV